MQKARATVGSWANVIGWRPLLCETPFGKKEKDQRCLRIAPQTRNPNFTTLYECEYEYEYKFIPRKFAIPR